MNTSYLAKITSEYQTKPKFMAMNAALLQPLDDIEGVADTVAPSYSLATAQGAQLDVLGVILGLSRDLPFQPENGPDVLDDATYRTCLQARIAFNQWDGTRAGLENILQQIFPQAAFLITDNLDMSVTVLYIGGNASPYLLELLNYDLIVPRPMGVQMTYSAGDKPIFAWDIENTYFRGWDAGTWI